MTESTVTQLDLRGMKCPMAFVKARLTLDRMPSGSRLAILYEAMPANAPLERSLKAMGHVVIERSQFPFHLKTQKNEDSFSNSFPDSFQPAHVELIQMIVEVKKNRK